MIRHRVGDGQASAKENALIAASFALGDAAASAWLWFALFRFTGKAAALFPGALLPVVGVPILAYGFGLHRFRPRGQFLLLARTLGLGAAVAALLALAGRADGFR